MKKITFFNEYIINKCLVSKTRLLFTTFLLLTSLIYAQNLPSNIYGMFKFNNGSLVNGVPNGEDLSGSLTITTDRFGVAGNAINPSSSITGHSLGTANYNNSTLSFWMKSSSMASTQRVIQVYGTGGNGFRFDLVTGGLSINARVYSSSQGTAAMNNSTTVTLDDNQWHNVVLRATETAGGSNVYLEVFVDNVLQSGIGGAFAISTSSNGMVSNFLKSAVLYLNPLGGYQGEIDDVYVYKESLTNAQISQIYNESLVNLSRIYVNTNVSGGDGSGDSWANAIANLSDALIYAGTSTTEIWVASGTYSPGSDRADTFNFDIDNLAVYGGFDGSETTLSQRDVTANPTILSGDVNGNDAVVDFATSSTSSRIDNNHQVTHISADNILMDGFSIEDGDAVHANNGYVQGSAMYISATAANTTLQNCKFNNNVTYNGGAVFSRATVDATITINNCIFNNNISKYASGLYLLAETNVDLVVNLTNSLFTNNISKNYSSADSYTGSSAWLRAYGTGSSLTTNINNCTFANNSDIGTISGTARGTLGLTKETSGLVHNATVANCIFYDNTGATGATIATINQGHKYLATTTVYNSIDEDDFSNISQSNLSNTSNGNPLFTSATDFTLQSGSPAIDTGDNSLMPSGITTDLLGNARIYNTTVDMGVYEFGAPSLGINDFAFNENEIKLYPNPTTSVLNIQMNNNFKQATIYSILGAKVLKSQNKTINVSGLSNGMFLIKIEDENGNVSTKRFIKN